MQKRTKTRLYITILCLCLLSLGTYLILHNLEQNIVFFYPPSKIELIKDKKLVRVGGLVKKGSIIKINAREIKFTITDNIKELVILHSGALPPLFRENQGVVAQGKLSGDIFIASELLIKHDENYRPPT